jgi:hypothetical protein
VEYDNLPVHNLFTAKSLSSTYTVKSVWSGRPGDQKLLSVKTIGRLVQTNFYSECVAEATWQIYSCYTYRQVIIRTQSTVHVLDSLGHHSIIYPCSFVSFSWHGCWKFYFLQKNEFEFKLPVIYC